MRNATRLTCMMTVGLILLGATCATAQDWNQWRGANRDGKVAGFTAPDPWPTELTQKWKVTVGAGDATPALVGDRLYVFARQGDDEVVLCLNAADGKEVWRNAYAAEAVGGPSSRQHAGPRSSPAVAEGKVVTLGVGGVLSCLNVADGKLLWRKDEFPKRWPQFYTASSPMIVDGMVIAQLGGKGTGGLMAFDAASGDVKWKWGGEAPEYASPVLMTVDGTKQVVTLTEKSVVSVALADGKLLWQVAFAPGRRAYNAATPIVDGQTVIVTGKGRGTRAFKVEKQGDGFAVKDSWSNDALAVQFNTPVLKDGKLYGLSDGGNLFCIDASTGKTVWTDGTQRGRGGFGAIVDAGTCLLALPANGDLLVFKPGDAEYAQLAAIKVTGDATYAHPLVSGKRIFVKGQDSLMLLTLD